jgi:hypothetical protein
MFNPLQILAILSVPLRSRLETHTVPTWRSSTANNDFIHFIYEYFNSSLTEVNWNIFYYWAKIPSVYIGKALIQNTENIILLKIQKYKVLKSGTDMQ